MTQRADRVYTDAQDIRHLDALIAPLADEMRVRLTLIDGSEIIGIVTVRPSLQTFLDEDGEEGVNAVLRLDPLRPPCETRYLWLDEVAAIETLPAEMI